MIENQNFIFRPWTAMPNQSNLDLNCTYTPTDIQNLKCNLNCDLNSIHSSSDSKLINSTDNQQCVRVSSIDKTKITTDAERLKRMLLNEKSNESKKIDKKYSSLKKVSNESLKLNQEINKISNQSINQINNVKTNHSPASSSAETRLINSRIAALSSASHLLNLDTYGRLTAPTINDNLAVAVVANPTNPLNFLLPNNNLSSNLSVANSLPVSNNEINLHPNQLLPHVHQLPLQTPNTIASSLSNNNLTNVNMSISLNNSLPKQQVVLNSQISLPSNIHQLTSSTMQPSTIHFDTKQWNEIVSTPILNQSIQSANLIQSNLSHQPVPLPSLIENSQFPNNINSLSSEILMANMKKSFNHQPKKNRPKKFICTVGQCDSSFANNGQLKNHIRSHTGERPFACDHPNCNKRFTRNEELTRHKKIHSGDKPFPCEVCGKRFGRKDHLKKHIRTHERAALPQHFTIPYLHPYYIPKSKLIYF